MDKTIQALDTTLAEAVPLLVAIAAFLLVTFILKVINE